MNHHKTAPQIPRSALDTEGYLLLSQFFTLAEMEAVAASLNTAFLAGSASLLTSGENIYAARNLTQIWPDYSQWAFHPKIQDEVSKVIGTEFGLVRSIFFDKNPDAPWGLPWHQDMTIAVKAHITNSGALTQPTVKRGVPHVEASDEILCNMLTARIHLDDASGDNGALEVVPGSHRQGKRGHEQQAWAADGRLIACRAGDVLLMRPLLYHRSAKPVAGNRAHRRVLHFEYAQTKPLPDGFEWHEFDMP